MKFECKNQICQYQTSLYVVFQTSTALTMYYTYVNVLICVADAMSNHSIKPVTRNTVTENIDKPVYCGLLLSGIAIYGELRLHLITVFICVFISAGSFCPADSCWTVAIDSYLVQWR